MAEDPMDVFYFVPLFPIYTIHCVNLIAHLLFPNPVSLFAVGLFPEISHEKAFVSSTFMKPNVLLQDIKPPRPPLVSPFKVNCRTRRKKKCEI